MSDSEAASKLPEPKTTAVTAMSDAEAASKLSTDKPITSESSKFPETSAGASAFSPGLDTKEETPKTTEMGTESKKVEKAAVGTADRGGAAVPGAKTAQATESSREPAGVTNPKPLVDRTKAPALTDRSEKEAERGTGEKYSETGGLNATGSTGKSYSHQVRLHVKQRLTVFQGPRFPLAT